VLKYKLDILNDPDRKWEWGGGGLSKKPGTLLVDCLHAVLAWTLYKRTQPGGTGVVKV
jgi:hypothetical protein